MKILMLVANDVSHDPRVINEAKELLKVGHEVAILGVDYDDALSAQENIDGITIYRIKKIHLMKLAMRNFFRLWVYQYFAYKQALKISFDILYCHNLDTLVFGVPIAKKRHKPIVYDAHEIYGYMQARSLPAWMCRRYLRLEKKLIKRVHAVITVNQPLKSYFESITNHPVTIIRNAKRLPLRTYQAPQNNKFTLLYIGTLTPARFLTELVDIVSQLEFCYLILGGIGRLESQLRTQCQSIPNVDFIGPVPMEQVIPYTIQCDVVISMTSPNDPNNSIATANKQYEAMVCGRPIICTANTYPGEFTLKENVGLVADYTKESLKEAIIKLYQHPELRLELGGKAFKVAQEKYNWDLEASKLISIINTFKR